MSFKQRMEKAIAEIKHEQKEGPELEEMENIKKPKNTFMHKLGVLTHQFVDKKKKEWHESEHRRAVVKKVYEKERWNQRLKFAKKKAQVDEQRKFEASIKKPKATSLNPFGHMLHEAKESTAQEKAEHAKKQKKAFNDMFMPPGYL